MYMYGKKTSEWCLNCDELIEQPYNKNTNVLPDDTLDHTVPVIVVYYKL